MRRLSWADNPKLAMGVGPYRVTIRATETYDGTRTRYSDLNLYVTLVAEGADGEPMLKPEALMADPYAEPDELLITPPKPGREVINIRPPEEPLAIEPYDDDQQDNAVITPNIV